MAAKITVLGGSSPFTAGLVEALRSARVPPAALWLHGRDTGALDAMRLHGEARLGPLGWTARSTTALVEALEDADLVVHQVRYGGLEGRAEGERLAQAHGLPADETLGPAALLAAIQATPALIALADTARRTCPGAWIVNLTNPLSIATAVLARAGLRAVGLCELPVATFRHACARLGVDPAQASFRYTGLNHRGFLVELRAGGRDRLADLARALGQGDLDGITAADIEATGALPLKYFRLLRSGAATHATTHAAPPTTHAAPPTTHAAPPTPQAAPPTTQTGRAAYLTWLRGRILDEIQRAPGVAPPSLSGRVMEWYPLAVVPFLEALHAADGRVEVVDLLAADGIVREVQARVLPDRLDPLPEPPLGHPARAARAAPWLQAFAAQERAALDAALAPDRARIEAALLADPLVPGPAVAPLTEALSRAANAAHARPT
ncbi:family 4 glycosyl hydrolase [Chondromyces apiculatus]|uniref:6-phospho-beta-glucosidase n=1 Tax=Chondromyces apiculatus DSM 436 TaxID=1192034 RepID=A0A017SVM6_9BACT|nr:hypothetical protein [Chondromyces apiculatus]EYF01009.1 Hypothetical protein CAP_8796 [Chondromyces apiculatus DSM 436]